LETQLKIKYICLSKVLSFQDQRIALQTGSYRTRLILAGYPGALVKSLGGRLWKNKNLILAGMEEQAAKKMEIGWLILKPSIEDLVLPVILPARTGTE